MHDLIAHCIDACNIDERRAHNLMTGVHSPRTVQAHTPEDFGIVNSTATEIDLSKWEEL